MNYDKQHFDKYYKSQEVAYKSLVETRCFIDYPRIVSIETFAKCNASCNFCPYSSLERIGVKMPSDLVYKIIDEVSGIAGKRPNMLTFVRVNEPFLDKRIFEFMHYVEKKLPGCPCPQTTNGTPLTDRVIDKLLELSNIPWLKISFNDHDPERYEAAMKLPFEPTVKVLDRLHDRKKANEIPFSIKLGRVGDGTEHDTQFKDWCEGRYPLFDVMVTRPFDWIGLMDQVPVFDAPDFGCAQWFDLHFLADGREAFCCIDANGMFADKNAATSNVLDIYNRPYRRRLREQIISRETVDVCKGCTY